MPAPAHGVSGGQRPTPAALKRAAEGPSIDTDLLAVGILALAIRLLFCFAVYPQMAAGFGPGDDYDRIAASLVSGGGYAIDGRPAAPERLPLYPLLLAAGMGIFGPASWPWQVAQSACGAVTCALVLQMARGYASRRAAVTAGVFCAAHPTLVLFAARPFTETLYALLLVLMVGTLAAPNWRGRSVGTVWGMQMLIKSTAALHAIALAPAIWRGRIGAALSAAGWGALVVAPWVAWNLWTSGELGLMTATSGRALYHGVYIARHAGWMTPAGDLNRDAEIELWRELDRAGIAVDADVRVRDRFAGASVRRWIAAHPLSALGLWCRNLALTWYLGRTRLSMALHAALHGALLAAAAVGMRRMLRRGGPVRDTALVAALLAAVYTVAHASVHPAVRYILPAVPLVTLLAAGVGAKPGAACVAPPARGQ